MGVLVTSIRSTYPQPLTVGVCRTITPILASCAVRVVDAVRRVLTSIASIGVCDTIWIIRVTVEVPAKLTIVIVKTRAVRPISIRFATKLVRVHTITGIWVRAISSVVLRENGSSLNDHPCNNCQCESTHVDPCHNIICYRKRKSDGKEERTSRNV